jgi:hypothetical protein
MVDERLNAWRGLFRRALKIIAAATSNAGQPPPWSFGGGTVLMLRYRHRVSRDIDIFLDDPQWLGYLSPRLNDHAAALTGDYVEQSNFVKLTFAEGEIDFIVAQSLTRIPTRRQRVERHMVRVEQPAEIIAKKVFHRSESFKARDILDFAAAVERDRRALAAARDILRARRRAILRRIARHERALREDFAALDVLNDYWNFDQSVATVTSFLRALDR